VDDKSLILDFLRQHALGVISTINVHGRPESAVIGFGQTADLEIIFGTSVNSRKAANIQHSPAVALVVGWDKNITVQYEGVARLLDGDEAKTYQRVHFAKVPAARKYANDPDERYFLIKPTWVRYTDLNQSPWLVKELNF
jgi:general stress protein 26